MAIIAAVSISRGVSYRIAREVGRKERVSMAELILGGA